jgi:gliding motility-associated-like protein
MRLLPFFIIAIAFIISSQSIFAQGGGCQAGISVDGTSAFCTGDSRVLTVTSGEAYLWSTGDTTQSIEVTQSGLYSVTVIDSTGCVASAGQSVAVLPALETAVVPNTTGPYCMGESVTLTAVGIPLVNQFQWSTGEASQSISVTQTGIYTVTVTNSVGCSASASLPMGFLPLPNSDIVANGPLSICEGDELELAVQNLPFGIGYDWSTGESSQSITITEAGSYSVLVTSISGCTSMSEVEISGLILPHIDLGEDRYVCSGDTVVLSVEGADVYSWPDGSQDNLQSIIPNVDTTIVVEGMIIGCNQVATDTIQIIVDENPLAHFTFGDTYLGELIVFEDSTTIGSPSAWNWNFGDGEIENGPVVSHVYSAPGLYEVTLQVVTENGCMDTVVESIEVAELFQLPNVLTPNNDGINDQLEVYSSFADRIEIDIYNRWGFSVYASEGRQFSWSGKTSAGADCEAGTYYYVIGMKFKDGTMNEQTGFFTLLRDKQ